MESLKRSVFCNKLNKNVVVTYFIQNINGTDGNIRFRTVDYFNCDGKEECKNEIILDCTCFRETKKVENEVNLNSKH